MKPHWASALGRWKAVEDAAHKLREELDKVANIGAATRTTGQQRAQPDQSSDCFGPRAAGSSSVKWCCCRCKVFALNNDGQHYCRCGYPIKSYAFYDMSPTMQALLPIAVVLAAIGLFNLLMIPVMNWHDTRLICDDIMLACP
jgi:hypothetical protein